MKNIYLLLIILIGSFNSSYSQPSEGQTIRWHFFKVEKNKMEHYETVMREYYQKVAQGWIDNGCQQRWIFRKIIPGATSLSREFNYMGIDVFPEGKSNRGQCPPSETGFSDGMAKIMMEILNDKDRVYTVELNYVAGYGTGKPNQFTIYDLTKTFKKDLYKSKHKEFEKLFKKHSSRKGWHALERIDPEAWGSEDWDYVTVNGFDSREDAKNLTNNFPEKTTKMINDKYGPGNEQREIRYRIAAELITFAGFY